MNLTFDVKNKGLVMTTSGLLTFDVMSKAKTSAEIREELGQWMKSVRESKGLSQKFVAEKIGRTETQLSRIENGKSGTERDTIIAWAKVVGEDENNALRKFKPENLSDIEEDDTRAGIFRDLKNLPPAKKQIATKQIRAIIDAMKEDENFDFNYIDD